MKLCKLITAVIFAITMFHQVFAQEQAPLKINYDCWVYDDTTDFDANRKGIIYSVADSGINFAKPVRGKMFSEDMNMQYIPAMKIEKIKFRKKGSVLRGTLIGAGAGILAGAGIGYATGNRDQVSFFDGSSLGNSPEIRAFFGGILGGIAGTLVGVIIGSEKIEISISKKHNRYKRQKEEIRNYAISK